MCSQDTACPTRQPKALLQANMCPNRTSAAHGTHLFFRYFLFEDPAEKGCNKRTATNAGSFLQNMPKESSRRGVRFSAWSGKQTGKRQWREHKFRQDHGTFRCIAIERGRAGNELPYSPGCYIHQVATSHFGAMESAVHQCSQSTGESYPKDEHLCLHLAVAKGVLRMRT
jgi:hypothetical protein